MTRNIGVLGGKGEGKDTLTGFLTNGFGYTRLAFGDQLKDKMSQELNIPLKELHDPATKEKYRESMQTFGELYRKHNPDVWVRALGEVYKSFVQDTQRLYGDPVTQVAISDVRHKNEFRYVRDDLKGFTVYVERPMNWFLRYLQKYDHISESQRFVLKDECEVIILNNGSLSDLEWAAEKVHEISTTNVYLKDFKQVRIKAKERMITPIGLRTIIRAA